VNIANERIAALMDAARALPGVRRASLILDRQERDAD
jgi:hypothetical protein